MCDEDLATVSGPNILQPKEDNPETVFGETAVVQQQLTSIMTSGRHKAHPFPSGQDTPSATPAGQVAGSLQSVSTVSPSISSRGTTSSHSLLRLGPEVTRPASSFSSPAAAPGQEDRSKLSVYDNVPTSPSRGVSPGGDPPSGCSSGNARLEDRLEGRSSPELGGAGMARTRVFGFRAGRGDKASLASFNCPGDRALRGFEITLKRQLIKQRLEYETRIRGLEERRQELEIEVQNVHLNLSQQRICSDLSEIKLRNIQQAREDAEKRNDKLQMEMEQFFDTFGDLTTR